MKVAISATGPELDDEVDPRFGRCAYLLFIDSETRTIVGGGRNEFAEAASAAGTRLAQQVVDQGAELVLTGRLGPKAAEVLDGCDVAYFTGIAGTVHGAINAYARGELRAEQSDTSASHPQFGGRGGHP